MLSLQSDLARTAVAGIQTPIKKEEDIGLLHLSSQYSDHSIVPISKRTETLWIFENGGMVERPVTYVPGLFQMFDEILVNAADNKVRDPSMDSLKVDIDADRNCITIYNNGEGIPIILNEDGIYLPEVLFTQAHTAFNSKTEINPIGGKYGLGAKFVNKFSSELKIETAYGKMQLQYSQVFTEGMTKKSEPVITKCMENDNWTRITFRPDLKKFRDTTNLEEDVVALMKKRVVDVAATLGKTVRVELNGEEVPVKSFSSYVDLYIGSLPEHISRFFKKINDKFEICICLSIYGYFQQMSFVNSINTKDGGSHVDCVVNQIETYLHDVLKKLNHNVNNFDVKGHLWVFVNARIDKPDYNSRMKLELTTPPESFGFDCELPKSLLKKIKNSMIMKTICIFRKKLKWV